MSSLDFEEAGHKLLKIRLEQGQGMELCVMVLECCTEEKTYRSFYVEDSTSSSLIFLKTLFLQLSELLRIKLLNEKLQDPTMEETFESIFPKDHRKNTLFSIIFFTKIGLGGITQTLRQLIAKRKETDSEDELRDEMVMKRRRKRG
ncbi:Initiation factor eIF-4 gamma, MA3 [Arabidopsis thaliana]|uniref:Initiation factor eIF-4 gamma, MA3 n=1 Tax=Arabidopsis thaliana TaxID=3702 RepID=F4ICW3_ARATH|nr:Initiation factor eIF-4 gamma, MA3 [Arabidopsis thaliana]AEE32786.1 Initiation factor eIF-4 gamma, MA3 [Arabidopsis thaliana]|eukprot:NP_683421.1 Initiation factor eIF-4 gamma, MA3 [Arabidopsis thaliana]